MGKNKKDPFKLSKKLLPEEREKFREIGIPNPKQDWLEPFTPKLVSDMFSIMESGIEAEEKAKAYLSELKSMGFRREGIGTNIFVMSNPDFPGVVFKVALDDGGITDNYNDGVLMAEVNKILVEEYGDKPRYNTVYARHSSGIVSVQEFGCPTRSWTRIQPFVPEIMKTLGRLHRAGYLIVDLAPRDYFLNYIVGRDGDWRFGDASDLYPIRNLTEPIRCRKALAPKKDGGVKRCGGRLQYVRDYAAVRCESCGAEYMASVFRPHDKEETSKMIRGAVTDGMNAQEREDMRIEEIAAIPVKREHASPDGDSDGKGNGRIGEENADASVPPKSGKKATVVFVPPEDGEEESDESSVERENVGEPSDEVVRSTATSFEDEEDEPDNFPKNNGLFVNATENSQGDEGDELSVEAIIEDDDNAVVIEIRNDDLTPRDDTDDVVDVLKEQMPSIWVKARGVSSIAISSEKLARFLAPALLQIVEDDEPGD